MREFDEIYRKLVEKIDAQEALLQLIKVDIEKLKVREQLAQLELPLGLRLVK